MPSTDCGDASAGDGLWRFALALYARPAVAEALIALQDRAGRDVNLLLFAAWLGVTRRQAIDGDELALAAAAIAPDNKIVAKIRAFRRELTAPGEAALRRRFLALELAVERRVLRRLAGIPPLLANPGRDDDPLAIAIGNLACCLGEEAGSAEADVLRRALSAFALRK